MASISVSQAMKAIKDEKCYECGRQAKGLVYRRQAVSYYCKRCLHKYMQQKERQVKEAAASPA
jgi:uncharacterized paraquat-inducible protein A